MNGTTTAVLLVVGSLLSGVGGAWVTGRWENKTQGVKAVIDEGALELDERRADGEAYERAQKISERAQQISQRIVESLQVEVRRLEQIIDDLRADLADALQRNSELEVQNVQLATRNAQLESHIRDLERSATTMRELLRQAAAEHPPTTRSEEH